MKMRTMKVVNSSSVLPPRHPILYSSGQATYYASQAFMPNSLSKLTIKTIHRFDTSSVLGSTDSGAV